MNGNGLQRANTMGESKLRSNSNNSRPLVVSKLL